MVAEPLRTTVYIIAKAQYVKVGCTSDLARRLREHDGCLRGCTRYPSDLDITAPASVVWHGTGDTDTEGLIMAAFYNEYVTGEWFRNEGQTALLLERLSRGHSLFLKRTALKYRTYQPAPTLAQVPDL